MKNQKRTSTYYPISTAPYDVQQHFQLIDIYEKVKAESNQK